MAFTVVYAASHREFQRKLLALEGDPGRVIGVGFGASLFGYRFDPRVDDIEPEALAWLQRGAPERLVPLVPENPVEPMPDPILQFFTYKHLPDHLAAVSKPFCDLAHAIVLGDGVPEAGTVTLGCPLPSNPQRDLALQDLLKAKDAAVRALLFKS